MSRQTPTETPIPDEIDSSVGKLVYLYLDSAGKATLSQIQNRLDVRQLTLYKILNTLQGRDIVSEDGDYYSVASG